MTYFFLNHTRSLTQLQSNLMRLLMALLFAIASLVTLVGSSTYASAQTKTNVFKKSAPKDGSRAREDDDGDGDGRDVDVDFTQRGQQKSCKVVEFKARFDFIAGPTSGGLGRFVDELRPVSFTFREQLTAGLRITNVDVLGAVSSGGGVPVPVTSTTVTAGDTVTIEDIKFDLDSIDGDGGPSNIGFDVVITAEIDAAAFPAPITITNQAFLDAAPDIGRFPSHDPATPEDGDWFTGTPTSIAIDLTDCDEPNPETPEGGGTPPDEACFKFERGEVKCSGVGDGSFTYSMDVGPESAGRKISLVPLTPGVTVDPAEQIAPDGGGVLTWTIRGATAGTNVSFTVLGTEFSTGPAEGWTMCCRQRIDIEIPDDIPCDDDQKPKKPDLAVKKKADVSRCKADGGCKFTITVTNVGDGPFTGDIALTEFFGPDPVQLDAPVPAPWMCIPDTSPMVCGHPLVTLSPGESVSLTLSFKPIGTPRHTALNNCASINYEVHGAEPFGRLDNDKACARIPYCERGDPECFPKPEKIDLEVKKYAEPDVCTPDGLCNFTIEIRNSGDVPINAPLTIEDNYPLGAPASSTFGPTPPWACSSTAPDAFVCNSISPISLPVGAMTTINVTTVIDPETYGDGQVENCVTLRPLASEVTTDNNKACAIARLPKPQGKPDLTVKKSCTEPNPNGGVSCQLTVVNNGTSAPSELVRIGDVATISGESIDHPVDAVTPDGPDWTCEPVPAPVLECSIPGSAMTPGASRSVTATYTLRPGQTMRNCLTGLGPDGSLATGPGFASQCVEVAFDKNEEEKQCSSNLIKNDAGRCVCPKGQKYRGGKCVGGQSSTPLPLPNPRPTPRPNPRPETKLCKKLPGQIRTRDNRCICRKGSKLNAQRTACVKPRPTRPAQCELKRGQIRTQSGKCVCPRGTQFSQRRNRCTTVRIACPKGTIGKYQPNCKRRAVCKSGQRYDRSRNRCITVRPDCRKGQRYDRRRNRCVTVRPTCRKGQRYDRSRNRCVTVRPDCRKGQRYDRRRNRCITIQRPNCKRGQVRRGNRCITVQRPNCKRGQIRRGNRCITVKRPNCKRGQIRRGNRCITVKKPGSVRPKCPRGKILFKGRCVAELI